MAALSMNDPAPGMLAGPDMDDIRKVRDEVYTICESSRTIRDRIPPPRKRNMKWIQIAGARWYLAWSGNTQKLSGKSCRYVLATECDKWQQSVKEGRTQDLVRERVKAFSSFKILFESTPTDESSFISQAYDDSNQCRYLMPCPQCSHWQPLRFHLHSDGAFAGCGGVAGYKDEAGKYVDPDEALHTAYYVCERGCRIEESDRATMISQGRWVPGGQWIDRKGKLKGDASRGKRVTGFNCTSLLGRHVTFGRIAAEFIRSQNDEKKLQNFINNWLGQRYTAARNAPKWREVGRQLKGGHPRETAPSTAFFLTAGVDVQADRCYWVVRAWGEGCSSWLVDFGTFSQRPDPGGALIENSDLQQVYQKILQRDWPVMGGQNPVGWPSLKIMLACCDVNYQPVRVWNWIRSLPGPIVRACAGDHMMNNPFFQMTVVEKNSRTGERYQGGMERWGINVDTYKHDIRKRWRMSQAENGYWWLTDNSLEELQLYLQHITNEVWEPKPTGRKKHAGLWVPSNKGMRWDYWDAEVYARAAADMVTGFEWSNLHLQAAPPAGAVTVTDSHKTDTAFSAR